MGRYADFQYQGKKKNRRRRRRKNEIAINRYTQTTEARQIRGPKGNREQLENPRSQAQRRPKVSKSVGKNTGERDTQVPPAWGMPQLFVFCPGNKPPLGISQKHSAVHPPQRPCPVKKLEPTGWLNAPLLQSHSFSCPYLHSANIRGLPQRAGDVAWVRHCPYQGSLGHREQKCLR